MSNNYYFCEGFTLPSANRYDFPSVSPLPRSCRRAAPQSSVLCLLWPPPLAAPAVKWLSVPSMLTLCLHTHIFCCATHCLPRFHSMQPPSSYIGWSKGSHLHCQRGRGFLSTPPAGWPLFPLLPPRNLKQAVMFSPRCSPQRRIRE